MPSTRSTTPPATLDLSPRQSGDDSQSELDDDVSGILSELFKPLEPALSPMPASPIPGSPVDVEPLVQSPLANKVR